MRFAREESGDAVNVQGMKFKCFAPICAVLLLVAAAGDAQDTPAPAPATPSDRSLFSKLSGAFTKPLHPVVKGVASTGGFGVGYDFPLLGRWETTATAVVTVRRYWSAELETAYRGDRTHVTAYARMREMSQLGFFGAGIESDPRDRTTFLLRDPVVGALASVRVGRWMTLGGRVEEIWPDVGAGRSTIYPTIETRFGADDAPGLNEQPRFGRYQLVYGAGGAALAPDPHDRYTLLEVDQTGFSPGYDVEDERGRKWSVKLGPEARTEVVVSRLVWAMGYHQPYVYYVPSWTLVDEGKARTEGPARFRLETTQTNVGAWSWRNSPFLDTQPFAGAFVLMAIVNNWDLKTAQNVIYRAERDGDDGRDRYVIKDLGASLGKTSWWLPGTRDDIEGFEQEPFIESVSENRVKFHFKGAWREPQLIDSVTPDDVRWICERLARLTSRQWLDAFRAGGYPESEARRFIERLQQKIDEGLALGSPSKGRNARAAAAKSR